MLGQPMYVMCAHPEKRRAKIMQHPSAVFAVFVMFEVLR